jgi:hypothetical protein
MVSWQYWCKNKKKYGWLKWHYAHPRVYSEWTGEDQNKFYPKHFPISTVVQTPFWQSLFWNIKVNLAQLHYENVSIMSIN